MAGDDWRTSGVVAGSGTITHDGQSDVLVSFIDEYGDNLSTITIGEEDQDTAEETDPAMNLEDYVGLWEYQGENRWLRIHDDSTWEFVNDQDDVIESGTLWVEENGITLHLMEAVTPYSLIYGQWRSDGSYQWRKSVPGRSDPVQRALFYQKWPGNECRSGTWYIPVSKWRKQLFRGRQWLPPE